MSPVVIKLLTNPKILQAELDTIVQQVRTELDSLASQTVNVFRQTISSNTKRQPASGKLSASINKHIEGNMDVIGIGKISDLPLYWYVINYGAYYQPRGKVFIPGGGKWRPIEFSDGSADSSKQGQGTARMTQRISGQLNTPIRAMNYIEKTVNWLDTAWPSFAASLPR